MMQRIPDGGVLCLVSKIPFFDFSFTLLDILRRNLTQAPAILERINKTSMAKLARGVEVSDIIGTYAVVGLNAMTQRMPRPLLSPGCDWSQLAQLGRHDSLSPLSRTLARWQVWWGLLALLMRWGDRLLEEVVLKLLPCVLLEQQVILFGDAQRTSVVALLLRSMLWPFKWQHLFVCAPWPPEELQSVPLMEAPVPFIFAFGEIAMLPHFWRYQSVHHLPSNIVAGVLRDRWVVISEKLHTPGGLSGKTMKFPPFVQTELRSQIKEARSGLRNQHGFLEMVQKVQSSVEAAMGKLAKVVKRYAHSQVHAEATGSDLRERCYQRAEREDRFLAWLREDDATLGAVEHVAFYKSFFQTQCFMHVLREEIDAEVDSRLRRP
ncbi:DENN domain-containing protein 5B (Rab6IP1-like protein) [Durusdinium trenchii]|uniref:DENN domain-containing protein 5B (Rab6IP1-like protein) n=1 Tax=Durusdinium trenchii TaxID=1381693 RepID=A0ABP0K4E9_9DINO